MFESPTVVSLLIVVLTSVATLTWWLSSQFAGMRTFVSEKIEDTANMFLEKLEYHERHDDKRFSEVVNSLWEIRLRNAAVEGLQNKNKHLVKDKE